MVDRLVALQLQNKWQDRPISDLGDTMILPQSVIELYKAHQAMCTALAHTGFKFTLDGRLLGDIAEALVSETFGVKPPPQRTPGVDGIAPNGWSVQVKSTQYENSGPSYSPGKRGAKHLIFVWLDFEKEQRAHILYNGPEEPVRELIRDNEKWTQTLNRAEVIARDKLVKPEDRLIRLAGK